MLLNVFQRNRPFPARLVLLAGVLCVAIVAVGCGGGGPAPGPTPTPAPVQPPFQGGGGGSPTGIIGQNPPAPQGALNPSALGFGDVAVGASFSQAVQISNAGNADLQVSSITLTGATSMTVSGITLPLVISPGSSVPFSIQFAPTAVGAASATVNVASNSTSPVPPMNLTGNGITAAGALLAANPSAIDFGGVTIGSPATQPVTLRNAGGQSVIINGIVAAGAGFSITNLPGLPLTLAPGQTQVLNVQFSPTAVGAANGGIAVTHDAPGSPTGIVLAGQGIAATLTLNVNPTAIDFGGIIVGSSATQNVLMTNTGNSSITVTTANLTGAAYSITGLTLPRTLTPGQSQAFTVQFAPTAAGVAAGNIALVSNASNSPTPVALTGNGLAQTQTLVLNPSSIGFGDIVVGANSTRPVSVTNTGNTSTTITAVNITGPNAAAFTQTGLTPPVILTPGQTVNFTARYAPTAAGVGQSATISLVTAAGPTDLIVNGNGIAQTLTLSVNPSVIGFGNVQTGSNDSRSVTVTNTGNANVTITAANITSVAGPACPGGTCPFSTTGLTLPLTLTPGQSSTFNARFAPTTAVLSAGTVGLVSNAAGSPTIIGVGGTGVAAPVQALTANPSSLDFGNVFVGNNDTRTITVTNTGTVALNVSSATPTGASYTVVGFVPNPALAVGASIVFTVRFTPGSAATFPGAVTIFDGATPLDTVTLTGTGVAQAATLTANPPTIAYGNVIVGQGQNQTVTITNTGNVNVTVNSVTPSGADFSATGIPALPLVLTPSQNFTFTARFAPAVAGAANGSVAVVSTASNSPTNVTLSGTGVATAATLSANPSSIPFGNVNVGSAATQSVTVTNTGNVNVTVNSAVATGAGYSVTGAPAFPLVLTPGQSFNFTARFAPSAGGGSNGNVAIASTATASPTNVTLTGSGVPPTLILTANPASVNFGAVAVGSNTSQAVMLTNTGTASVTVNTATPTGAGFSVTGFTAGTLTPGQSMNFNVVFAPAAAGAAAGNVSVASTATASPTVIMLSGAGQASAPGITVNPSSINFGSVVVGSNFSQNILITNTGTQPLSITAASVTGTGFTISGLTTPLTINPGQSSNFTARFAPAATGASSGSISLTHNAAGSPSAVALSGSGVTGLPLSWDASASPVAGYRVYRSNTSGTGYTILTASLVTGLNYVDATAQPGQTYFYVVTAVDAGGIESTVSNELRVTIP